MSALVLAELASSCAALGRREARARRYLVSASSAEAARELVRFLHRDGPEHEVRRQLGRADVLQTDLAPLLQHHAARRDLFGLTLRLLINLTNPALALYNEEVPVERSARHNYLEILSHLQKYKAGVFTTVDFWKVLAEKLVELLQTDWKERDDDTSMMIERILILIRNVLHVPADEDDTRPDNDASVHDQVLWALNQSGMLDVIQYMCSENERQYFMHILEIISLLLREQNPTSLASAALQRSVDEKVKDEQELLSIRMSEMKQRNDKVRQFSASRHSRFGGTYVVQNMKSISDNDVICLKPLNKISNLDFGGKKEKLKRPKNRRPVESESVERRSSFSVRLVLKQFCEDFLNCSYNPLMHYVRDALVRSKGKQNDESYYLWALKFFMEFNRGNNFNVGLVSETMSVQMFHYVQLQMEKYFDMIKMEKKKGTVWVKRLHLALRAYKELLNTLTAMDKSGDESVRETAKVLKSNIFYVLEYREFMITTFLLYNDAKMPRSYLVDLVETTHLFLKMLEHFCKKTGLVVQKKLRKKSKKKKSNKLARAQPAPAAPVVPHWEEVRPQIAAVLTMSGLPHPPPFDAASDTPIDEQRAECIKNIQKLMMESKYEESIGMLRAAREVWPEEGIFGVVGIPEDEELNMLENIYVAELEVDLSEKPANPDDVDQLNDEDDNDEEDEEGPSTEIAESDFNFLDFAYRFCNPSVTSACSYLLEEFDKNLPHTNHCALKLLHRTAWDCQLPSMMFQASLFRTFQRILALKDPRFKELEKFAIFILRKFVERAASEPKLFLELLFWKKVSDAKEIEHGYAKYGETENSKSTAWSEEQEEELRKLYMENQTNPQTDQDVIDWIQENLIDQTRTRRSVIKKLKELGLIFRAPTKKSNARPKVPVEFTEEEDDALRNLWEKYGDTSDPMSAIINRMPMKRKKQQLVERLLELAIIQDKRQCRKKKDKKSGLKSAGKSSDGSDNDDSHSDSENDNEDSHSDSNDGRPSYVKQRRKKPDAAKPRTQKAAEASVTEIAKILIEAVDTGLSDALSWLAECLEEVALDQEAEGFDPTAEGVPLVPISSESVQAMESELFKLVLTKLGVEPPSDEQEIYWRIPSSLSFQTLRKRKEVILRAIEKTLIVTEETSQSVLDTPNIAESTENVDDNDKNNDSSDEDVFSNLRKIREATRLTEEPILKSPKYRKRTRSVDSDENDIRRGKIHKIDEVNSEGEKSEEDDMLSFAKKTLPAEDMPNTEDFFNNLLENIRSDIETESVEQMAQSSDDDVGVTKKGKKRRIIDDDSE